MFKKVIQTYTFCDIFDLPQYCLRDRDVHNPHRWTLFLLLCVIEGLDEFLVIPTAEFVLQLFSASVPLQKFLKRRPVTLVFI